MSDIVTRLREATVPRLEMGWPVPHVVQRKEPLWQEAADEIERLRNLLLAKQRVCDAAQAALDRCIKRREDDHTRMIALLLQKAERGGVA